MRALLVSGGAAVGLAAVLVAWFLSRPQARAPRAACLRYFLIPAERVCGGSVFLVHDGRRDYLGHTRDLAPMPKPPARRG